MTDSPTSRREAIARIIAPAAFLPESERDGPMRNEWKRRVFAKADAILASDGREIVKELVEASEALSVISDIAAHIVSDEAIVDVTYSHNHGKKYGIVQRRMKHFRRLAAAHAKAKEWLEGR